MKITARTFLAVWLALAALLGSHFAYDSWLRSDLPSGLIQASGRIGGDPIPLPAGLPGRIVSLDVKEGDLVEPGQTVGELDGSSIQAELDEALHERDNLLATRELHQSEREIMKQDVPISIQIAKAALHKAEARLEQSRAVEAKRAKELDRIRKGKAAGDPEALERAELALVRSRTGRQTDEAETARLAENVKLAELGYRKIETADEGLAVLQNRIDDMERAIAAIRASMGAPSIKAPIGGVVTRRLLGVGDHAPRGQAVAEMADLDRLYLKVSLPEDQIARLAVGLPARVWLESHPDTMLTAKVGFIAEAPDPMPAARSLSGPPAGEEGNATAGNGTAPEGDAAPAANATGRPGAPRPMYGVKLYLDENPGALAMPGQTGVAVIRYDDEVSWRKPRKPFRK
ncbi:MAG: HlyD family efflux transporter periplasmic adaptor subunit [Thermodesulfobacteriota bacterium]